MSAIYNGGDDPIVYRTVTFNANGGTCATDSVKVSDRAAVGELPTATRANYTFLGWFAAAVGGEQVSSETVVTADGTWYAQWERITKAKVTVSVVGDAKGVSVSPASAKTYTVGKTATLKATGTSSRWFVGWYADADCTELISTETSYKYTVPAREEVTVYAKFAKKSALVPAIDCAEAVSFTPGVKLTVPVKATSDYAGEIKVSASGLPDGLKYYSSGKISGTPKACSKAVTVTVTAKNAAGTTTKQITFTPVNPGFAVAASVLSPEGASTSVASKGKVRPYLGVNFEMALAATPNVTGRDDYAANKVSVSGLANGLSFDKMTNKITGVPTKTGKQTVKATFTNKWGWSTTFQFYIYPKALPTWLVGDYNGCGHYGSAYGTSRLTVSSTGKVSGKIVANGSSYSFSVNSFTSCTNAADGAEIFTARAKVNSKYYALFTFAPLAFGADGTLIGTVTAASEKTGKAALEAYRGAWAIEDLVPVYKSTTLKLTDEQLAQYGTGLKAGDALKVKVSSKKPGTATITGTLAGKAVSVSAPVVVSALETVEDEEGATTTAAFGEIVVPYGKKNLVLPLTWTAGSKLTMLYP